MVLKGLTAAVAAVALSATPALAAAQAAPVVPVSETVEGESQLFGEGGFVIPLLVVVAIVLGILADTGGDDEEDLPVSP